MTPKIETIVQQLQKARKDTLATAQKVTPENRLRQLQAGKATPLWLLGHLANTLNSVVLIWTLQRESQIAREVSKMFAPDFAGGKAPSANADDYPPWEEVVALYDRIMGLVIDGVSQMVDDQLPEPLAGKLPEPLRAFFSSNEVTLYQMISHDAYHRGQLGLLGALAPAE
ncbi:MAG: DUF664 domain-containing protein [Candidatus Hydrogenedens sp.]|nr:DUF664 domain-containing protein [Candidatus Hydrogenedens sp.]